MPTCSRILALLSLLACWVACAEPVEQAEPATGRISGNALLAGMADHTGVTAVVPGTSALAVTDLHGAFVLEDLPPGSHEIELRAPGYLALTLGPVTVTEGVGVRLDPVTLESAAPMVRGRVELEGRSEHGGAMVSVGTRVALTAADGRFEVGPLPDGAHRVLVRRTGYVTTALEVLVEGGPVDVGTIELAAAPVVTGTIRGTVTLAGLPGVGVSVFVSGTDRLGETNAQGQFILAEVPGGISELVVTKPGYVAARVRDVAVQVGEELDVGNVDLLPAASSDFGSLAGRALVLGASDHRGTTVRLEPVGLETPVEADGSWFFDVLEPGTYDLRFERPGFVAVVRENVEVERARGLVPDAILRPGRRIGDAIVVAAQPLGDGSRYVLDDADGATWLYDGAAGSWIELDGPTTVVTADESHAVVVAEGTLEQLALANGESTAVTPAGSLVGTADGVVFYESSGHVLHRLRPGEAQGTEIVDPSCSSALDFWRIGASYGSWRHLQIRCRYDQSRYLLVEPATGRFSPLGNELHVVGDHALVRLYTGTDPDLVRFELQSGQAATLATGVSLFELHPDRGYAWYVSNGDLYVLGLSDGAARRVTWGVLSLFPFGGPDGWLATREDGSRVLLDFAAETAVELTGYGSMFWKVSQTRAWLMEGEPGAREIASYDVLSGTRTVLSSTATTTSFPATGTGSLYWQNAESTAWYGADPTSTQPIEACAAGTAFGHARWSASAASAETFSCGNRPALVDFATGYRGEILPPADNPPTSLSIASCRTAPNGRRVVCTYTVNAPSEHPWSCQPGGGAYQPCTVVFDRDTEDRAVIPSTFAGGIGSAWSSGSDAIVVVVGGEWHVVRFDASGIRTSVIPGLTSAVTYLGDGGRYGVARENWDWALLDLDTGDALATSRYVLLALADGNVVVFETQVVDLRTAAAEPIGTSALLWSAADSSSGVLFDSDGARLLRVTADRGVEELASACERVPAAWMRLFLCDVTDGAGELLQLDESGTLHPIAAGISLPLHDLGGGRYLLHRNVVDGAGELLSLEVEAGTTTSLALDGYVEAPLAVGTTRVAFRTRSGLGIAGLDGSGLRVIPADADDVLALEPRLLYEAEGLLWADTGDEPLAVAERHVVADFFDDGATLLFSVPLARGTGIEPGTWRVAP